MKNTQYINLFGGPGVGKSSLAAEVFSRLKGHNIDCELVIEHAKILTWSKRQGELACQPYVFGKQLKMMHVLKGQVDFVVTDSPLLLSAFYSANNWPMSFKQSVIDIFNGYNNINYRLTRTKPYNPNGRNQTLDEAVQIDYDVKTMLDNHNISYKTIDTNMSDPAGFVVNDALFGDLTECFFPR